MIREELEPEAAHGALVVTPDGVPTLRHRASSGAQTATVTGKSLKSPVWLRLDRSGASLTASLSNNSRGWKTIGTVHVPMGEVVTVGLVATNGSSPRARHAPLFITPSRGVALQYRPVWGGEKLPSGRPSSCRSLLAASNPPRRNNPRVRVARRQGLEPPSSDRCPPRRYANRWPGRN